VWLGSKTPAECSKEASQDSSLTFSCLRGGGGDLQAAGCGLGGKQLASEAVLHLLGLCPEISQGLGVADPALRTLHQIHKASTPLLWAPTPPPPPHLNVPCATSSRLPSTASVRQCSDLGPHQREGHLPLTSPYLPLTSPYPLLNLHGLCSRTGGVRSGV